MLDETIVFIKKNAPKIYKKELVELLFEQPYSKIGFVVNQLGVDRKTALKYLRKFEEIGILESQKVGREVIYLNKNLLTILEKP